MFFSKVVGSFIGKYRGGSKNSLIVKSEALNNQYQSKIAFAPGLEINPGEGERIVVSRIDSSDSYLVNIAGISDNVEPDTLSGERRLFSVKDGGDLSSYIKLTSDEKVEVGGNENFTVLFNELKTQFNELQDKYNSLVTAFTNHTHPYVDTPVGASTTSVTASTADQSTADIEEAKSLKILLPNN